jgi:hypothetical protein
MGVYLPTREGAHSSLIPLNFTSRRSLYTPSCSKLHRLLDMTVNIIPLNVALFTPDDMVSFCRVAAGWIQRGLCGAVLRTRAEDADILLVMCDDGSAEPLWFVEKYRDQTYWLVNRSRQVLACGATMDEVLGCLDLPAGQAGAFLH